MTPYSHSRLNTFENCPLQFRYRYIDKIRTETEGIEAFVGKRVHEILERLYHHLSRHSRPPSLAQVQDRFLKDWLVQWHPNVRIVRLENDVDFYRDLGTRCLENYYRGHYPFDDGETVGIEQNVTLSLDEQGRYQLRGIIDRIVRRSEGRYEIHDYKTSGSLPPRSRLDRDRQLALYQIGLEQTYDDVEQVELVWHYLAFDKTITSRRSADQLEELRRETIELIDTIESANDYPARPGPLCRWCEYSTMCPEARADARPGGEALPLGPEPPAPGGPDRPREPEEPDRLREPVQLSLL